MSDSKTPDVSRRGLVLGGLGLAGGLTVASCQRQNDIPVVVEHPPPEAPEARLAVAAGPPTTLQFLNDHQGQTVEAIAARLIPGTEDDPGAREAGAVFYIDQLLARHNGHPMPVYMDGPYAQTYTGDQPPEEDDAVVWVQEEELERYGWQSAFLPQEIYRMGLTRLDQLANTRHGGDFIDLNEDQQDELLAAVEDAEDADVTEIFGDLRPGDFFDMVRSHTIQGFLADPLYGGNRNMVGWRLIGFPGSRRSYSPADMLDENYDVTPQSLLDLPPFNADRNEHHHDVAVAVRTRHPLGPID